MRTLRQFFYEDEVMPLLRDVTIPLEEQGVLMDVPYMRQTLVEIDQDLSKLEDSIQYQIATHLGIFREWFLNKDFPTSTPKGKTPAWAKKYATQYDAWLNSPDRPKYMFNLQSDFHLRKLFFDTLGETPLSKTDTGLPRADEEFLQVMSKKYSWAAQLVEYNKLSKIKSTYIERFLNEVVEDRFYPEFKQHGTVSGRYSGDLQQLPRPLEASEASDLVCNYINRIRAFVLPDHGSVLLSADYEQLEPTIFAHISGDPALQAIFNTGIDFYSEVAIRTERLQDVSSDKKAPNYLGKINKAARQKAKAYALGIAYGMTGYKMQFELGVSQEEGDELVEKYLAAFPKLAEFMQQSKAAVLHDGYVRSQAGRVRRFHEAQSILKKHGTKVTDSLHIWKQYHQAPEAYGDIKQLRKKVINAQNNAINFQVQSLAASIVNRAAIKISKLIVAHNLRSRIVLQVHDELVLNVPENEIEQVSALVKEVMENIVKLSVPLRTVPQIGRNFKECK